MSIECDIVVVGGGPGGYVAAIRGAQLGARVVLIERENLGGTCLNWGCIPSKALIESAERYQALQHAGDFGLSTGQVGFDFAAVHARKTRIVKQLRTGVEGLVRGNGITLLKGTGSFLDRTRLSVRMADGAGEDVRARKVIIASGSIEARPPIEGIDSPGVMTSREALQLEQVPRSIIIVGGGPVGVEFATVYNAFGSQVTVVEMMPTLLPLSDADLGKALAQAFTKRGMNVRVDTRVNRIAPHEQGYAVSIESSAGAETLTAEKVLNAVGRVPYTEGLGLERIGVALSRRAIKVDAAMRTNLPDVYAIGDVVGGPYRLAHVGATEGEVAVEHALGQPSEMDYRAVPEPIFCSPQVAGVGMTEQRAAEAGHPVKVGRFPWAANSKALSSGETEGFVKVVCEAQYGQILGVHIIGPHATDLIAEAALAINLESTVEDLAKTIHAHPTLPEAVRESALAAGERAVHVLMRKRR
ncbi:MAG: dihydrolipoyl dehydrogenase [Chloroflexi bacterium]|nr:dihydrolipoyl dehydrogenase [Chloroflexota bacterium]